MSNARARTWRTQFIPWRSAGNRTETGATADEVVQSTGWVFNNETGKQLTLADFVETGDKEVRRYMRQFGFTPEQLAPLTLLEIGSGIGRMTASFTRQCAQVIATDVDAAFLERCHETVGQHGRPERLRTTHVTDGRTLQVGDRSVDVVFSYITLQHCERTDALSLTREAVRVARDGATIMLNYRSWVPADVVLIPLGVLVRALWRLPIVGGRLSQQRWATRFGWQANRLSPDDVLGYLYKQPGVEQRLGEITVHHSAKRARSAKQAGVTVQPLNRVNASHWWLVIHLKG
jgi:ubiquinone/menaquinone biosynthesis C-methylase UbiE